MSKRNPHRAYLALGSNIDPKQNLPAAVRALERYGRIAAVSRVWESAPVGFRAQPNFLNAAVLLETALSARDLCEGAVPSVERMLNRVRDPGNKNAPRTIDIDLVLFDREVFAVGSRKVPDPDLLTRAFVAVPVAEVDPQYVHPEVGRTLEDVAGSFSNAEPPLIARPDVDLSAALRLEKAR